jgi:hypothetical protein
MSEGKLKAKIDEFKEKGAVSLSSTDVGEFGPQEKGEPTVGDVKASIPDEAKKDPMVESGAKGDAGQQLAVELGADSYATLDEQVNISEDEREAFLTALIQDSRFVLPFSIYGGKIKGKIRARSQAESQAILTRLGWEMDQGMLVTGLDYTTRMRNMLMAAQVQEAKGEQYTLLTEPYFRTVDGDTITEPGWLAQVDQWGKRDNAALVSAIYEQVRIFERKYWTMVASAKEQNFWTPAESTSE